MPTSSRANFPPWRGAPKGRGGALRTAESSYQALPILYIAKQRFQLSVYPSFTFVYLHFTFPRLPVYLYPL